MEFYAEWKLREDGHGGCFSNGLSLTGSQSAANSRVISEDPEATVIQGAAGHRLTCRHIRRDGVWECSTVFENCTEKPAVLELLSNFAVRGIAAHRMHRAQSFWSAEGRLLSQDLVDLDMEPSWSGYGLRTEKFGQNGSMPVRKWFPFLALENTETGKFTGFQLYCASSWQMEVFRTQEPLSVWGGLPDRDTGHWFKEIAPGESFETPKAVIAEGDSLEEVCDKLVKAQRPRIAEIDRDMPVIFNEFCTTWGNPSLPNLQKTAEKLEGSGVRYLVIDAGWYKKSADWSGDLGDWIPNPELFPNGIGEAARMIRSCGLVPGIWFEMENAACNSDAWQMTDHLLKKDGVTITSGGRRFWDMADPWVQEYLSKRVIGLLRDNGFGYLKVDYNETIGIGCDGAESLGEGLRQRVCASQDFFRKIAEELPELVIENCSSGGHRLEPSMMELVSQASFSDAHECVSIPIIAANLHRLIRPEQSQIWAVLHAKDDIHRIRYLLTAGFLGRLCLSGEIFDLNDGQWGEALAAIRLYDKVKRIIRDGFTEKIACTARSYAHPEGCQIVRRTLGDEALLIVHTFEKGGDPPIAEYLDGYEVLDALGSNLDGDFQGRVYWLRRQQGGSHGK